MRRTRASSGAVTPVACKSVAPVSPRCTGVRSWPPDGGSLPAGVSLPIVGVDSWTADAEIFEAGTESRASRLDSPGLGVDLVRSGSDSLRLCVESHISPAGSERSDSDPSHRASDRRDRAPDNPDRSSSR
ncbi:MAG: hypothetical protein Q8K82_11555 [Gemmatimonadaceae bacterium]|nr:hypothetical protein [Gemmatimonadaceae bacterium]